MIGIVGALVLRTVFIALGAALLERVLVHLSAVRPVASPPPRSSCSATATQDPSIEDNVVVAAARRRGVARCSSRCSPSPQPTWSSRWTRSPPCSGSPSTPTSCSPQTRSRCSASRPLYFLVSGLLDRLVYLSSGLAVILGFIGMKLVLHFLHLHDHEVPEISTGLSLGVIAVVLAITTVASLLRVRRDPRRRAHAGSLRARPEPRRVGSSRDRAECAVAAGRASASACPRPPTGSASSSRRPSRTRESSGSSSSTCRSIPPCAAG